MIRTFQDNDQIPIKELIRACYAEYDYQLDINGYDKDIENIGENYNGNKACFWVFENNSIIIACIAINAIDSKNAELKRFYIDKSYRGKGIADELYNEVINWCKENKKIFLHLKTDVNFTRAINFYKRKGFLLQKTEHKNDYLEPYSVHFYKNKIV